MKPSICTVHLCSWHTFSNSISVGGKHIHERQSITSFLASTDSAFLLRRSNRNHDLRLPDDPLLHPQHCQGKGTGPLLNDEEPVIPNGRFFPLDPPGGDLAMSSSNSEQGLYFYLCRYHHSFSPIMVSHLPSPCGLTRFWCRSPTIVRQCGASSPTSSPPRTHHSFPIFQPRPRRQLQAFLRMCVSFPVPDTERTWCEEARFAAPTELAMCFHWGLTRVGVSPADMPSADLSPGTCTSNGAKPKSVSGFCPALRLANVHSRL